MSLSAADDALRKQAHARQPALEPLAALHQALAAYPLKPTRRITFEYVLLGGVNDRPEQAAEALAKWLKGLPAKVNLIAFNPHRARTSSRPRPTRPVSRPFRNELIGRHVTALVRKSRGADISAACGQLAAKDTGGEPGS